MTKIDQMIARANRLDDDYYRTKDLIAALREVLRLAGKNSACRLGEDEVWSIKRRIEVLKSSAKAVRAMSDKAERELLRAMR